jgi:hypothetical protein
MAASKSSILYTTDVAAPQRLSAARPGCPEGRLSPLSLARARQYALISFSFLFVLPLRSEHAFAVTMVTTRPLRGDRHAASRPRRRTPPRRAPYQAARGRATQEVKDNRDGQIGRVPQIKRRGDPATLDGSREHREPADRRCAITSLDNLVSWAPDLGRNSFVRFPTIRSHIFLAGGNKVARTRFRHRTRGPVRSTERHIERVLWLQVSCMPRHRLG